MPAPRRKNQNVPPFVLNGEGAGAQCGFFRCTTLPDCPFSGLYSQSIQLSMSARVLNKLASFCEQETGLPQSMVGRCELALCRRTPARHSRRPQATLIRPEAEATRIAMEIE
jgi:hypothetical protein